MPSILSCLSLELQKPPTISFVMHQWSGCCAVPNISFNALQALQAAVGEQVAGGVLVGGEGGRPVYWDSPQATPDGVGYTHACWLHGH